jgi:hypothetical protein
MHKYKVRPGYGTTELLIEFNVEPDEIFFGDLYGVLKEINVSTINITDLWVNDEVIFNLDSDHGQFELSKDIWDFVFIMATKNQVIISIISNLLNQSGRFIQEKANFNDYVQQN